jgi:uncharacterized protein YhbP (UPF0306 family)
MQHVPSKYIAVLQKQQAKACWKCCKTPKKVTEISVYTQKFPANKYSIENVFVTFLRLIYKLKNKWKWLQKIIWQRKEIWSVRKLQG